MHQTLLGVSSAVEGLKRDADDLLLELEDVRGLDSEVNVLSEVGAVVVEGDQEVARDVGLNLLDSGNDLLGQVEDGVLVGLHRLGRVHHKSEGRVDDRVADGRRHRAEFAFTIQAPIFHARAVVV